MPSASGDVSFWKAVVLAGSIHRIFGFLKEANPVPSVTAGGNRHLPVFWKSDSFHLSSIFLVYKFYFSYCPVGYYRSHFQYRYRSGRLSL